MSNITSNNSLYGFKITKSGEVKVIDNVNKCLKKSVKALHKKNNAYGK